MTPHKSLGQEVRNSTANRDEVGCSSIRLQWLGLEHSQPDVVNTSVVMKSTSVISGQSLISQKARSTRFYLFLYFTVLVYLLNNKKHAADSHAQTTPSGGHHSSLSLQLKALYTET